MERIVRKGIKVDFHIHSIYSVTKDDLNILKNSTEENLPTLIEKLKINGVEMCAITDHDTFNYNLYQKLKTYENDTNSSLVKVLPGIEFSVMFKRDGNEKQLHVIALFSDENNEKLKNIESVLNVQNNCPAYDKQGCFSEQKFIQILAEIGLDTVLIVHQKQTLSSSSKPKKNDANSLGEHAFNLFIKSEYFEAFEFKNRKNELFNNLSSEMLGDDLLRFITGSDCHDWNVYPRHDVTSSDGDFKFTYFKCLPTFKGLVFALTDKTRISLEDNFFTQESENYVDEIEISIKGIRKTIPLSRGLNAIIGDNSIGKSLLLHALTNYYREEVETATSSLDKNTIKGYKKYLEDKEVEINSCFSQDKIYRFDTQGEIRKLFGQTSKGKSSYQDFFNSKYPLNADIQDARKVVNKYVELMVNYLNSKFDYDISLTKITNLVLPEQNIKVDSLTYNMFDSSISEEIKIISGIICQIKKTVTELEKLIGMSLEANEISELSKIHIYLEKMCNKYEKQKVILNAKNNIINCINKTFNKILNEKQNIITTEEKRKVQYFGKSKEFKRNIITAFSKKFFTRFNLPDSILARIIPSENPYLNYIFVKRTDIDTIDGNYIGDILCTPMKKGVHFNNLFQMSKEEFVEKLLRYNEEEYPNCIEYYTYKINQKIESDFKSKTKIVKAQDNKDITYSDGINAQIYFDIICGDRYANGIYLIDQPEDDISQSAIKTYLLSYFKKMSNDRQIILVTHNPQFVVNLDVDNVIVLSSDRNNSTISIQNGALEYSDNETNIIDSVATTLDGGIDSIRKRWKRYEKDNYYFEDK